MIQVKYRGFWLSTLLASYTLGALFIIFDLIFNLNILPVSQAYLISLYSGIAIIMLVSSYLVYCWNKIGAMIMAISSYLCILTTIYDTKDFFTSTYKIMVFAFTISILYINWNKFDDRIRLEVLD